MLERDNLDDRADTAVDLLGEGVGARRLVERLVDGVYVSEKPRNSKERVSHGPNEVGICFRVLKFYRAASGRVLVQRNMCKNIVYALIRMFSSKATRLKGNREVYVLLRSGGNSNELLDGLSLNLEAILLRLELLQLSLRHDVRVRRSGMTDKKRKVMPISFFRLFVKYPPKVPT